MSDQTTKNVEQLFEDAQVSIELKKRIKDLEKTNKAQYKTIQTLIADSREKDERITHLEGLLKTGLPVLTEKSVGPLFSSASTEEEICEMQIRWLKQVASQRDLTLEEARKFEIYAKVKKMAKEDAVIEVRASNVSSMSEEKLLQIAESSHDDSQE